MIDQMEIVDLEQRLAQGTPTVSVLGLGYVGLPVSLALVEAGCAVIGLDISAEKVATLARGETFLRDVSSEHIRRALATERLRCTTDMSAIARSDAVLICVPTPITQQKEPDTSYIADAARSIAAHLRRGHLVILRSTSYPGTTNEVVRPILEATGLAVGRDFFLAFAPERISPGNTALSLEDVPLVVGGLDPTSTRLAGLLLGRISRQIVPVSSSEAAEMAKLLENVFRNVNIALVNQMAQLCDRMGLNIWEIVAAAGTKPYGFMPFQPGLVGGHCIPVDPYYLSWKAREHDFHMDFIELAARVNEGMPFYVVDRLLAALHDQDTTRPGRVLVLGVAFKKDVDDVRHSPAVRVIEQLRRHRIEVVYHDPYIPTIRINGTVLSSVPLTRAVVSDADCVLILTDHSGIDYPALVADARLVFDTRNATSSVSGARDKIILL